MNERIEKLAKQAGYKHPDAVGECEDYAYFDHKEFAELIVLECTKAVMDGTKEGDHYAMRIENHFDNGTGGILHFGVEE
jgi:hypothetical protein